MNPFRRLAQSRIARFEASRSARRLVSLVPAALLALHGSGPAQAQTPSRAQLARGEHLARMVCSACHVVATDQEFPPILDPPAPAFADIANRPGTTAKSVRHFVMATHWDMQKIPMTMPNPMLMPEDAAAVASYLTSLRRP